jgi:hypothetical protein
MSDNDDGVPLARVISYDAFAGRWHLVLPHVRAWARATDWIMALSTCPDAGWLISIANDMLRRKALSRRDFVRCAAETLATFAAVCPAAVRAEVDLRDTCAAWCRGDVNELAVQTLLERMRWANALRLAQEGIARMILGTDHDVVAGVEEMFATLPARYGFGRSRKDIAFAQDILVRAARTSFAPVLAQALEAAPRCPQPLSLEARA